MSSYVIVYDGILLSTGTLGPASEDAGPVVTLPSENESRRSLLLHPVEVCGFGRVSYEPATCGKRSQLGSAMHYADP